MRAVPDSIAVAPVFGVERRQGFRWDADVAVLAEGLGVRKLACALQYARIAFRFKSHPSEGGSTL